MTLQIEEGKFYKTRDGRKVGPMRRYAPPFKSDYSWVAEAEGSKHSYLWKGCGENYDPGTRHDIVAEWVDDACGEGEEWGISPPAEQQAVDINQMLYGDDPNRVTKKTVLETALQTVADRGVPYGGVEDNFNRIARLWNAHLFNRFDVNEGGMVEIAALGPEDVAMMMALMKIARLEANPSHADSWVDVAGYAACGGEIGAKLTVDKPSEL